MACCILTLSAPAQDSPYQGVAPTDLIDGDYYLYNVETGLWLGDNYTNTERYSSRAELGKRGIDMGLKRSGDGYQLNPKLGHNHSLNAGNLYMDTGEAVTTWALTATDNGVPNGVRITSGSYTLGADASGRIVNNATERDTWQFVTRQERMAVDTKDASADNPAALSWAIYGGTFPTADERRKYWQGAWGSNSIKGEDFYRCNMVWEMWGIRSTEICQELTDLPNGLYAVSAQALYSPTGNDDVSAAHLAAYENGTEPVAGYVFAADIRVPMKSIYSLISTQNIDNFNTKAIGCGQYMPNGILQVANNMFEGKGLTDDAIASVDRGRLRFGVGVAGGTGTHG